MVFLLTPFEFYTALLRAFPSGGKPHKLFPLMVDWFMSDDMKLTLTDDFFVVLYRFLILFEDWERLKQMAPKDRYKVWRNLGFAFAYWVYDNEFVTSTSTFVRGEQFAHICLEASLFFSKEILYIAMDRRAHNRIRSIVYQSFLPSLLPQRHIQQQKKRKKCYDDEHNQ